MKKYLKLLASICAIIIIISMNYANRRVFINSKGLSIVNLKDSVGSLKEDILNRNYGFSSINSSVEDSDGCKYILDRANTRITKVNPNGTVMFVISAKTHEDGVKDSYYDIRVDSKGNVYVLNYMQDKTSYYVERESIEKYNSAGIKVGNIAELDHSQKMIPGHVGLLGINGISDNSLLYYKIENNEVLLKKVSLDGSDEGLETRYRLPRGTYIQKAAFSNNGTLYYSTKTGKIFRLAGGRAAELYRGGKSESGVYSVPGQLKLFFDRYLVYIDNGNNTVYKMNLQTGEKKILFSNTELIAKNMSTEYNAITDIYLKSNGNVLLSMPDRLIYGNIEGKVISSVDHAVIDDGIMTKRKLIAIGYIIVILLIAYIIKLIYFDILKRKTYLMVKQLLMFIPIVIIAIAIVSWTIYTDLSKQHDKQALEKIVVTANVISHNIDADSVSRLNSPDDFMNGDYKKLRGSIIHTYSDNIQADSQYCVLYKIVNGNIYTAINADGDGVTPFTFYTPLKGSAYENVVKTGVIQTGEMEDPTGYWMFAMAPVYDANHNITAIFETGFDVNGFRNFQTSMAFKVVKNVCILIVIMIVVFLILSYYLFSKIEVLRRGVSQIAAQKWDTRVNVNTNDEVKELADGFNMMADHVQKYISQVTRMGEVYFRFFPQQFIHYLGKKSVLELELGDQAKKDMTILTANIKDFNGITSEMSSEDKFSFINKYLSKLCPIVAANRGTINVYMNDGIQAFFEGDSIDAVKASIGIAEGLNDFDTENPVIASHPEIQVAVDRGEVMLGIIGEKKRMQSTAISENITVSEELVRLAQAISSQVILSENVVDSIKEKYEFCRYAGKYRTSSGKIVKIYDFYEADGNTMKRAKNYTKEAFEKGVFLYQEGHFYDARLKFVEVVKNNRSDEAAKLYFYLSDIYYKQGTPDDWHGELVLDERFNRNLEI